jgi:muramidase (phage lysozyme)
MTQHFDDTYHVDPSAYHPLLNTIAKGESGGNYNAYYGNPGNTSIHFTDMTIGEVLAWQEKHVSEGNVSSAVGKYQIIRPTLQGLVSELAINHNETFDEALQDRMAIALLERRGSIEYVKEQISREQFAENIAKEWAALPKATGPNPHASYYAGDGINKSNIAVDEVFQALDDLQGSAKKKP